MHALEESRRFPSGRTVADCRKDAKRLARSTGITLSEAQHQIAIKNGSPQGWARAAPTLLRPTPRTLAVMSMPPMMSMGDVRAILKLQPYLTYHGYGPSINAVHEAGSFHKAITAGQQDLLDHVDECNRALRFLEHVEKRQTNNPHIGNSYTLKNRVKFYLRHVEKDRPEVPYVSNGAFICAALHSGFTMKISAWLGPNVTFNMSSRSPIFEWQRLAKRPTYGSPALEARKERLRKLVGASTA